MANDLKLKGPVREIGIVRDHDRHDSFNITIGITIKTEGRVSYEEAERLSNKFRREYLGKDVKFVSVSIPCPVCGKIMNSESGLKKHVAMNHPEKVEIVNPPKVAAKVEKPKKMRGKTAKPTNHKKVGKRKGNAKSVKAEKAGKTVSDKKQKVAKAKVGSKVKKSRATPKEDVPAPVRSRVKVEPYKTTPMLEVPAKHATAKATPKAKQLTLT